MIDVANLTEMMSKEVCTTATGGCQKGAWLIFTHAAVKFHGE